MLAENNLALKVIELAAEACVQLFMAYDVVLERSIGEFAQNDDRVLCGVIGFVGRGVRGTCLLAGNELPLARSCPEGGRLRDWVGELSNQLAGRLKSKLLARKIAVSLTTPVALSGIRLQPLPRRESEPVVLCSQDGQIMVWVEVESEPGLEMAEAGQAHPHREGEVLLFSP